MHFSVRRLAVFVMSSFPARNQLKQEQVEKTGGKPRKASQQKRQRLREKWKEKNRKWIAVNFQRQLQERQALKYYMTHNNLKFIGSPRQNEKWTRWRVANYFIFWSHRGAWTGVLFYCSSKTTRCLHECSISELISPCVSRTSYKEIYGKLFWISPIVFMSVQELWVCWLSQKWWHCTVNYIY